MECALEGKQFVFYGDVFIKRNNVHNMLDMEYEALEVYEVAKGEEKPFLITATTWAGTKLNKEDAIADCIGRYSRNESAEVDGFELMYLCEDIKQYLDVEKNLLTFEHQGREIPYYIFYGTFCKVFSLGLATDKFLYYMYDDEIIMLNVDNSGLITDNYFAEIGFEDSLEAIEEYKEKRIHNCNDELRKVLLTNGMTDDCVIIHTDAPKKAIEEWCRNNNMEMENGENSYFNNLEKEYYLKVLLDSENVNDARKRKEIIGYNESYEISNYI